MSPNSVLMVEGGAPLRGELTVAGAKNTVSKLLVASLLSAEPSVFYNVPRIEETRVTRSLCQWLGASYRESPDGVLEVATPVLKTHHIDAGLAGKNRLAIMLLGPMLHRLGRAVIPAASGGDRIGPRPVDFHIEGFRRMGARVELRDGAWEAEADALHGAEIILPYPSVTTTENLLMAAVGAKGRTFLRNAAVEPEILDLVLFLQKMGAIIDWQVDRTFIIEGVPRLTGASHRIMPDKIVSASLGAAAVASGGDVFIRGARQADLLTFLNTLRRVGGVFEVAADGIRFRQGGPLAAIALETNVHPGFATDWQPPFVVLLTQAAGISVVHETVFENRFGYVHELQKMQAEIQLYDTCLGPTPCRFASSNYLHSAVIKGPSPLQGAEVMIPDLRAGFSCLIAAILARGRSVIHGAEHIDRGYENIESCLRGLGACIERREDA